MNEASKGIIPSGDADALRGNVHEAILAAYEMKDKLSLLMSATETCGNKLQLAIHCSETDSLPYISYHRHLCEKLKYALELREQLEDFIEHAESQAIFAGVYRGFDYPEALEYIKDVVNPYWGEEESQIIYDGSYLFEEEREDDYYWGDKWDGAYDTENWFHYYEGESDDDETVIVQSWYQNEDPWEIAYNDHKFVTKEGTINILDNDGSEICDLMRYKAIHNAQDPKFNFGVNDRIEDK